MKQPNKPKPSPIRIIYERDDGQRCPICKSSIKRFSWLIGQRCPICKSSIKRFSWLIGLGWIYRNKCIQPECKNYYKKEK